MAFTYGFNRAKGAALCCTVSLLGFSPAYGQTPVKVLDEIVVTAQKKEQSIQDVPVAISAFSGSDLEQKEIQTAQDLQLITPGLTYTDAFTYAQPYIRGIGSDQTPAGADSSVATFVDGIYQSQPQGVNSSLFGIERIEVLKGPQGTLFGRNATGGAISIFTKNPSDETERKISVGYGNYNAIEVDAYLSGPLTENIGANLSVSYDNRDGFGENLANPAIGGSGGQEINDLDRLSMRGKVQFQPTDSTDVTLTGSYFIQDDATSILTIYPDQFGSIPVGQFFGGNVQTELSQDVYAFFPSVTDREIFGLSANISHSFGDWTLTSLTGYTDLTYLASGDFDGADIPIFTFDASELTASTGRNGGDVGQIGDTFTQEIQLAGELGNVSLVAGAYYLSDESGNSNFGLFEGGAPTQIISSTIDTEAFAIFGHAILDITDQLTATGGIRYSYEKREQTKFLLDVATPMGFVTGLDSPGGTISDDDITIKLALAYDLKDDVSIYGKYESGFRSGVINSLSPAQIGGVSIPFATAPSETVDSFELGLKSRFAGGRAQLNAAAFLYDYQNLQVQFVDAATGATNLESAPEAEVYGMEVELSAYLTDNFRIDAGLSWLETEYKDFVSNGVLTPASTLMAGAPGNVAIPGTVLTGNELTRSPNFTFNLAALWTVPVGESGSLDLTANSNYSDQFFFDPANRTFQDDLILTNASATYKRDNSPWSATLWVRNLTDEKYFGAITPAALGDAAAVAAPRTYGARLAVDF